MGFGALCVFTTLLKKIPTRSRGKSSKMLQVRMQSYGALSKCPSPLFSPLSFQGASRIITLHGSSDAVSGLADETLVRKGQTKFGGASSEYHVTPSNIGARLARRIGQGMAKCSQRDKRQCA